MNWCCEVNYIKYFPEGRINYEYKYEPENSIAAIAACNYPKGQPDCNGHSTVFDGVAWLRNEPEVRDMCILEAPKEETGIRYIHMTKLMEVLKL